MDIPLTLSPSLPLAPSPRLVLDGSNPVIRQIQDSGTKVAQNRVPEKKSPEVKYSRRLYCATNKKLNE